MEDNMLINSMLDLIGNTPIIKLNSIETFGNNIFLKLEGNNPSKNKKSVIQRSFATKNLYHKSS